MAKIKVGIIGVGDRGVGFVYNFREYADLAEIAGVLDTNRQRLEAMSYHHRFTEIPRYDTWESFTAGAHYDLVLVTTPDDTHPAVITRCLEAGYNVFADKPLANTPEGLLRIMEAYDRSGRMLLMGFNVRYQNVSRKMKEIAQRGDLGEIKLGVCHHPEHGIRYFRRWHKFRAKSGGLVIHKGCHQLDILNWIIGSYPVEVYAQGDLAVFKGAKKGRVCHSCDDLPTCPYARRLDYRTAQKLRDMYISPAALDGYHRNYCPISDDADVPDFYLVTIRYANGARASYTEVHFAGESRVEWSFFGTKAEMSVRRENGQHYVDCINHLEEEKVIYPVATGKGGHGGADPAMTLDMILSVVTGTSRMPPPEAGVRSSIIGIAAMRSIDENRPIRIEELIPLDLVRRHPDEDLRRDAAMEALGYAHRTEGLG